MRGGAAQRWRAAQHAIRTYTQFNICIFFLFFFCSTLFKTLIIHRTGCCFILWDSPCLLCVSLAIKTFISLLIRGRVSEKFVSLARFLSFIISSTFDLGERGCSSLPSDKSVDASHCTKHSKPNLRTDRRKKKLAHWFGLGLVSVRVNRAGGFVGGRDGAPAWLFGR